MAKSTSYGMGQYRWNKNYKYIQNSMIGEKVTEENAEIPPDYIEYHKTDYQDVKVKLPTFQSNNVTSPYLQYGSTYYMRLTVPQHNQYDTILNLKLCPENAGDIDASRFQQIKRLVVPKTPEDDDVLSDVMLFEVPENECIDENKWGTIDVQLWDEYHDYKKWIKTHDLNNWPDQRNKGEIYFERINDNGDEQYRYYCNNGQSILMTDKYQIGQIPQTWKMRDTNQSTVTFDFVFSPKYNLTGGYSYLLIETDRSEAYHQTIQYVEGTQEDKETYYGTRLNKEDVHIELYGVSNLIQNSTTAGSQIQSGTSSLSHIAVWGHPGLLLAINGEEIKIGQSGFYELDDFTINQLGVVVRDPNKDRFTIDYEYKNLS